MRETLIREATTREARLAVLSVAHAANRSTDPFAWYAATRLRHPLRQRGRWWLLLERGMPVCSLMSYPLTLRHDGRPVSGYGLGAVATHPDARGRGHASCLCAFAGDAADAEVGVLFSAIAPALYERLGFRGCPAFASTCTDLAALASGPAAALDPIDPRAELERLIAAFDGVDDGLRSARDATAWDVSLRVCPGDRFFAVAGGYVRLATTPTDVEVVELVADDPAAVLRGVGRLALQLGRTSVQGWFSPPDGVSSLFEAGSRARTLPMVRGPAEIQTAWLSSADYF